MIGKTVAHYKILEKLGEGGMGVVYLAEDTKLGRTVALKFLPARIAVDDTDRARFVREAQAAAALDHPNICTVHEINEYAGETFIVMAYVEGRELSEVIAEGPLNLFESVDIALQVAGGLQAAHEKGVLHRDIKPSNIRITSRGQAKIMDFGLAKLVGRTQLTRPDAAAGTIAYMSPEQTRGEGVDNQTDVWALGVVLYEMLTGRLPFRGDYGEAIVYSIVNEKHESVSSIHPGIPAELERIIDRAMSKSKADRYPSVSDMIADLEAVKEMLVTGVSRKAPGRRRPRPGRRGVTVVAAIAIVLVVLAVVVGRLTVRSGAPDAKAIAVLPFENLSGDEENEYFSNGITEDILTQLSKIGELTVISRASVMHYKDSGKTTKEIGKELHVGTVLSGSVRRAGDQVRIVGRLIDAGTERQLWGESYDREMKDIFAIQTDVAKQIAAALQAKLTPSEEKLIEKAPTVNLTAYDYYLKGRDYYYHYNRQSNESAIELFEKAIALDDNYALAYTGLGDAYAQRTNVFAMGSEWVDSAIVMSRKALFIDPELAEAHKSLGTAYSVKGWLRKGLESTKRAVEINPNLAAAIGNIGGILGSLGRCDEAMQWMKKAVKLSPTAAFHYSSVGSVCFIVADDESAEEWFRKALDIEPDFGFAQAGIGYLYLNQGLPERANEIAGEILDGNPGEFFGLHLAGDAALATGDYAAARPYYEKLMSAADHSDFYSSKRPSTSLGYIYWKIGETDSARMLIDKSIRLDRFDLEAGSEWPDIPYDMAAAHAVVGETEDAVANLKRAVDAGWRFSRVAANDPLFERIRDDEGFNRIIEELEADVKGMRRRMRDP